MSTALYVALGGAVGTLARHFVGVGMGRLLPGKMPWGTLTVNVAGAFLIGFIITVFAVRDAVDSPVRIALTVGVLGGFTTYSAFAFEVVTMVQERDMSTLALYLGLLFPLSLGGCVVGIALARALSA